MPSAHIPPAATPHSGHAITAPRIFLLAIGLAVLVGFFFQGSRGLYESTEGRYAQCAKETLESGNFLEPVLDGAPHWTKPPLAYMPIAAGIAVLGNNAWGARIFQSVFFVLTVFLVYVAGREMWGARAGAMAALIYATSPFTAGAASTVSTDNLLTLFECAAVAAFWIAMRRGRPVCVMLTWVALALAFLTKGPVGLIPLTGMVPAYVMLRREGATVPHFFPFSGVLTFLALGLSWYVLEIILHPELLDIWLIHETLGRLTSDEFHRNAEFHKIFTLYLPIVLFGTGPWAFLLLYRRRAGGTRWKALRNWGDRAAWTYVFAGFLIPLALFSASHSRLPLYLLPLFIPMTLAMGKAFSLLVETGRYRLRTVTTIACVAALIFVTVKAGAAYYPSRKNMAQLAVGLRPALEAHPGMPFVLLADEPLNGLEFYLNRRIPLRTFPNLSKDVSIAQDDMDLLAADTLVLLRRKHLRVAAPFLPAGSLTVLYEDPFWGLVALKQPVSIVTPPDSGPPEERPVESPVEKLSQL